MSGLNDAVSTTFHDYLRFRLGNEWYGIDVDALIEVMHFMILTEMPVSRPGLLGMMRLRELIVPVVDLRVRFGLPNITYTLETPIIVVNADSAPLGLVVDDVDGLEQIESSQIKPHDGSTSTYITGIARLPNTLLLLLDLSLLGTDLKIS
jgi:purine-binding chemotaxis protein CheW